MYYITKIIVIRQLTQHTQTVPIDIVIIKRKKIVITITNNSYKRKT